jgi:hypothetical protein
MFVMSEEQRFILILILLFVTLMEKDKNETVKMNVSLFPQENEEF